MFLSYHYLDQWLHVRMLLHVLMLLLAARRFIFVVFFQVCSTILPIKLLHTCILAYVLHIHDHVIINVTNLILPPEDSILIRRRIQLLLFLRSKRIVINIRIATPCIYGKSQIYGMQQCTHTIRVVRANLSLDWSYTNMCMICGCGRDSLTSLMQRRRFGHTLMMLPRRIWFCCCRLCWEGEKEFVIGWFHAWLSLLLLLS